MSDLFLGMHSLKESSTKSALAEEAEDRTFPNHVLGRLTNERDSGEQ
jgi:hypothetical protein